jgi:hypothetical protein
MAEVDRGVLSIERDGGGGCRVRVFSVANGTPPRRAHWSRTTQPLPSDSSWLPSGVPLPSLAAPSIITDASSPLLHRRDTSVSSRSSAALVLLRAQSKDHSTDSADSVALVESRAAPPDHRLTEFGLQLCKRDRSRSTSIGEISISSSHVARCLDLLASDCPDADGSAAVLAG